MASIRIKDLLEQGLITINQEITHLRKGRTVKAVIRDEFTIITEDNLEFNSLSSAANHFSYGKANGWTYWNVNTRNGRLSMDQLRKMVI